MSFPPQFGDIAHLGHVEILTPKLAASVRFFSEVLGFVEAHRTNESVYLRAWGDYESCTLKLSRSERSGVGHVGMRVRSQAVLDNLAESLQDSGIRGAWLDGDWHHGPAFRCVEPDGHVVEVSFETKKICELCT